MSAGGAAGASDPGPAGPASRPVLLARAKARLDPLALYPRPVSLRFVRLMSAPWLFRLPVLRRFHGYATWWAIFVRMPLAAVPERLVVHELCHVWQMQHHPLRMPLSYLRTGYRDNPYEVEARAASDGRREPAHRGSPR